MKKLLSAMALGLALVVGVGAEAGSIPTNRVPLQTYAIKRVNCYLQPNGTQKGWIDPGDYVVVTQIRSDGWAYGSYPVGRGRTNRWFRANDLVNNVGFANQDRYSPKANTAVYRNPNYSQSMGSFNNNESIVVVSDSGQSRQVIYKLSNGNGYKMGWVPYWDCWSAEKAGKSSGLVQGVQNGINLAQSGNMTLKLNNLRKIWEGKSWEPYGHADGANSKWPDGSNAKGGECFGFANYIYKQLHGTICGQHNGRDYYVKDFNDYGNKKIFSSANYNIGTLRNVLINQVKPGDFIQGSRSFGNMHSMIFVRYDSKTDLITVFDANAKGNNMITFRDWKLEGGKYDSFIGRCPRVSIYTK